MAEVERLKANYEIYSDKSKNAVTDTQYIKHKDQWLDEALGNIDPHWIGTKEEYEAQKDTIEPGTTVIITDDYSEAGTQHNDLIGRSAANAHPISAITGLQNALDGKADVVIPEMFGAKGDGITDDTTAIRDALAYAYTNKKQTVFLGKTYLCTGLIEFKGQVARGTGISQTELKFTGSGYLRITGMGGYVGNMTIRKETGDDYLVVADYISQSYLLESLRIYGHTNVMQIRNSWYASVKNLHISSDVYTGTCLNIHATADGGVNNLDFSGIFIHRGLHSVVVDKEAAYDSENIGMFNCTFEHCKGSAIVVGNGTMNFTIDTAYMEDIAENSNTVVCLEAPTNYGCICNVRGVLLRVSPNFTKKIPLFSGNVYCDSLTSANYYTNICLPTDNVTYNNVYNSNLVNGRSISTKAPKVISKRLISNADTDIINVYTFAANTKLKVSVTLTGYVEGYAHVFAEKKIFLTTQGSGANTVFDGDFYSNADYITSDDYNIVVTKTGYDDKRDALVYKISVHIGNKSSLTSNYSCKLEMEEISGRASFYDLEEN